MTTRINGAVVDEALKEGKDVDRQERIAKFEKELEKVQKDIAEQKKLEKRYAIVQSAFAKLKKELGKTLTEEERQAVDGIYLFLHSGCVDMVRSIPSATSRGEDVRLLSEMDMAEALQDIGNIK